MKVRVKLYGILKTSARREELELDFETAISIRQLVRRLAETIARSEFEKQLIDPDLGDPRPNALIMVSGTEIGGLDGLETKLNDGDEIVFLPVAHGGT